MKENTNNDIKAPNVPYIAYESDLARMERVTKRLTAALTLAIAGLVVSNLINLKRY